MKCSILLLLALLTQSACGSATAPAAIAIKPHGGFGGTFHPYSTSLGIVYVNYSAVFGNAAATKGGQP